MVLLFVIPFSLALVLSYSAVASSTEQVTATIYNDRWRKDTQGRIVNAHDGQLVSFDGGKTYLLYGTVYAYCSQKTAVCDGVCGYDNNTFAVLSSPDLMTWTLESDNILPSMTLDNRHINYWEANVGLNKQTGRYIMSYWTSRYGFVNNLVAIASSSSPYGNFTNEAPIALKSAGVISDTIGLFIDDDNTAYIRVNTRDPPLRHTIEKLTPDWLSTTGEFSIIFEKQDFPWYDGGGVVKNAGRYFTMLSFDCCFCQWGSDALVFIADSPIGKWLPQPRLPHRPPAPSFNLGSLAPALQHPSPRGRSNALCNVNGSWSGVLGGQPIPFAPNVHMLQEPGSNQVTVIADGMAPLSAFLYANGSFIIPAFPGYGFLQGAMGAFESSPDACTQISWIDYSPPHSFWCRYPVCKGPVANWTNEVNYCADGSMPPLSLPNMYINPCSPASVDGTNFTIPAQQFNIASLYTPTGIQVVYFGELFRSSPDGIKAHDYQAWIPIYFSPDNYMLPMRWQDSWPVTLSPQQEPKTP